MARPHLPRRSRASSALEVRTQGHGPLRASAARMELRDRKVVAAQARRRQQWQSEAWTYFDDVPEIKYATWFEGNVMAKCRWFVAVRDVDDPDADPVPIDEADGIPPQLAAQAKAELARLKGPLGGKSEIARELNMNLEIAGEAYLVGFGETTGPDGTQLPEEWDIKSISEVDQQGGRYRIKADPDDAKPRILDPANDTIIRIWQRHPEYSLRADCAMRGVLSDCEGALLAGNAIKAEAKSQMSAGILLLSNNLRADSRATDGDGDEGAEEASDEDDLSELLYEASTDPIQDPASAASVNPLILFGDPDDLEQSKHLSWARTISKELPVRLELHVNRIARGLNMPVEVTLGHQSTTFSNAEQVSEDTYTQHFEPRCVLMSDALSVGFLQPNLLDVQPEQRDIIERVVVWFDPKGMLKPVDPMKSSNQGITDDLISSEAWRRVNGWSEDDAPKPIEQLMRLVLHLRSYDRGTTTALLELYGVELDIPETLPGTSGGGGAGDAGGDGDAQAAARPGVQDRAGPLAAQRVLELALVEHRAGRELDVPALLSRALAEQLRLTPATAPGATLAAAPARALPPAQSPHRAIGYRLMTIDRDLRSRLATAADAALDRTLERAGARLRSRALKASGLRPLCQGIENQRLAATLGPTVVRAVATDADLIGEEAWTQLEQQFLTWGAQAQQRAIDLVNEIVGFPTDERELLQLRQSTSLGESWDWLREQLDALASARLYGPDPLAPEVGEFDPSSKVPTGMLREALARAGGATGLTQETQNPYVVVNNGDPVGGIGTGELVMGAITAGGGEVDAYEWVYGDAFRTSNFEPHLDLDATIFVDFTSELLASAGEFDAFYYPGDHNGCVCDWVPVIVAASDVDTE